MDLLKKEYWWVWLLFLLFGNTITTFILGAFLDVYDKNAWYANWRNWLLGLVLFIFPFFIMLAIFYVQITIKIAEKLDVYGKEWYSSPYVWILCCVMPIIGWIILPFMFLFLQISIIIQLSKGEGEKYI